MPLDDTFYDTLILIGFQHSIGRNAVQTLAKPAQTSDKSSNDLRGELGPFLAARFHDFREDCAHDQIHCEHDQPYYECAQRVGRAREETDQASNNGHRSGKWK